jgi:hypothetical protein
MTKSSNTYINYKIYLVYEIIKEINYIYKKINVGTTLISPNFNRINGR